LGTEVASLNPGVYNYSSSAGLTGTLTLNDGGDPNAVFIFKMGSTLTTASYSKVVMSSGGNGPNVFWVCGSSATIGTYTTFVGNTIALASITMTTGATTTGRLFALNGAVTMDTNNAYASAAVPKAIDTDGDGVPDAKDDYPTDPNKAYNNYSSPINGSTIVFEDLWPDKGDYDMNDLVMKYKYNVITNAQNNVTQVIGNFTLLAAGTGYKDAFAIEFPIANGAVSGLTGGVLEAGQNKAVIVLFTDKDKEINGWNTLRGVSIVAPKNYTISFDVINGPSLSLFGTDYNPFIFNYIGSSRKEVHLPGKTPTTLSDLSYFGTLDDASSVSAGKYYVTKTGLPFAIIIPSDVFEYPFEYADISTAYLHFADWAESGGTKYADWYSNTSPAYRNTNNIFH
jgi:LruC domain-containing protein